jgi:hypothetical protein
MTVCAVLASLIPILWASGIGSDVMKPIAAPRCELAWGRKTMDGFSIRPTNHRQVKGNSLQDRSSSHTLDEFNNDGEEFDKES